MQTVKLGSVPDSCYKQDVLKYFEHWEVNEIKEKSGFYQILSKALEILKSKGLLKEGGY